jgi:hypothetical protein
MCNAIEHYLEPKEKVFKVFPELLKYKPEGKSKDSAWWYNDEFGKQMRIKVLTELIQELNSTIVIIIKSSNTLLLKSNI